MTSGCGYCQGVALEEIPLSYPCLLAIWTQAAVGERRAGSLQCQAGNCVGPESRQRTLIRQVHCETQNPLNREDTVLVLVVPSVSGTHLH